MAKIISEDDGLEMLDMRFGLPVPLLPLIGGYASDTGFPASSYLLYRRK